MRNHAVKRNEACLVVGKSIETGSEQSVTGNLILIFFESGKDKNVQAPSSQLQKGFGTEDCSSLQIEEKAATFTYI